MTDRSHQLLLLSSICLFLTTITLCVYWQVRTHDFVNYDDNGYVTSNRHVRSGLTWENVGWAFTSGDMSNWHPLTWLSHMLDCEMYGLDPKGHHLTNLFFHVANTILLFLVLTRMTSAVWRPALVAALFAVHPLHVESVAWVAERKDVLSGFFCMIAMLAYAWYTERPGPWRYLVVWLSFALGLMAKPMLVTLPFVLLLLDYWPLSRLGLSSTRDNLKKAWKRVREKLPLFALALASCIVTFLVQRHGPAVQSLEQISFQSRIANALVAYVGYMVKMIRPSHLAVYYPHPMNSLPAWQVVGATLVLISISIVTFRQMRSRPYLIVGWLWYLGMLVPVIGILQVGGQAMADRYTYLPMIGLFISVTWGVSGMIPRWAGHKVVLSVATGLLVLALALSAWFQAHYWRNSETLFEHALQVTANNQLAHNQLGLALSRQGRTDEAIGHFLEALRITPQYVNAHINLGNAFKDQGKLSMAVSEYQKALHFVANHITARNNLGIVFAMQGDIEKAVALFSGVLKLDPNNTRALNNMGIALAKQGKFDKAIQHFSKALRIDPESASARKNLEQALIRQGNATGTPLSPLLPFPTSSGPGPHGSR